MSSTVTPGLSARFKGLLVSFTVLAVAFCTRRFSLPVFYPVFADPKKFGGTHAEAAAGGSVVLLLIGLLGPLVGWLADKYPPKAVILGGCVTFAAALALLSTTQTLLQWYLFCTLLGIGIATGRTSVSCKTWSPARRKAAPVRIRSRASTTIPAREHNSRPWARRC
jgi:MFS family permease